MCNGLGRCRGKAQRRAAHCRCEVPAVDCIAATLTAATLTDHSVHSRGPLAHRHVRKWHLRRHLYIHLTACLPFTVQARLRRETPFICNIKFANEIPEPPSDPKLLVSEADPKQMATWALSSGCFG